VRCVLLSGKASPGVTASTWALALAWPAPVLAVDADAAGGDMVAGLLAGRVSAETGLPSWCAATRRLPATEAASLLSAHTVVMPEADHVNFMPGLQSPAQVSMLLDGGWDRLAQALRHDPRDVLIDAGRLCEASAWPVIHDADRVLLGVRGTVRSVHVASNAITTLREHIGDLDRVALVFVGRGAYSPADVRRQLSLPVVGSLPHDVATADALTDGARVALHGLHRTKLLRAAREIAAQLHAPHSPAVGASR